MVTLPKKTEYALIALHHLMDQPDRVASAREIAELFNLPCALLMNVMKELQQGGLVRSTRGAKGGYQLAADPAGVSLYTVIQLTSSEPALTECCRGPLAPGEVGCQAGRGNGSAAGEVRACPIREPLQVLHHRLVRFLKDVKLTDLLRPTHIDVPLEMVGVV